MNCNEFNLKISEYIDGELSKEESGALLSHAQDCGSCRKKLLAYQKLSESVKASAEKIPGDFKVILPKKRNNIISLLREHEGLVSAMVAAIALMIFAGGIGSDTYKAPVVQEKETTILPSAEIYALPESEGSNPKETTKPSVNVATPAEDKAIANQTSVPLFESVESTPEASAEVVPEIAAKADMDTDSQKVDNARQVQNADLENSKVSGGGGGGASGGAARAAGGAGAIAASEGINNTILNYNMPPKEEFADENLYNDLNVRLESLKERAKIGAENLGEEFNILIIEIEKAAKK